MKNLALVALALALPAAAQDAPPRIAPPPPTPSAPPATLPAPPGEKGLTPITVTATLEGITPRQRRVPLQLSIAERDAFAGIFRDIDAGRYSAAETALTSWPNALLRGSAQAQLYLARGTGRVDADTLVNWLVLNRDLPQAPKIAELARARGATDLPPLPPQRELRTVSFNPRMTPASAPKGDGPRDAQLAGSLRPLLAADRNSEAESEWRAMRSEVSEPVRTEWAQRIAWSWYIAGDDASAARMGGEAASGTGEWAALGAWTAGLAAFRQGNCEAASASFDTIEKRYAPDDLASAGAFWAARAHLACNRPHYVNPRLQRAARYNATFYGLLAQRTLGLDYPFDWSEPDFITADWNTLAKLGGAKRAAALMEIGQIGLADRELRYLASIADPINYAPLLRLSARLNLPATQYWLAHRPPPGIAPPLSARFPAPDWVPYRGWRVDSSLVFAHALQESNFITTATSRAGAKGVMQLMPGTARLVKGGFADPTTGDLADPAFNIELGQTYLEQLRDMSYTQGLLPKVVAAYNAGPGSVQKWNATLRDNGDPLLFIESVPFRETRHYVEVVMRNFWMYQLRAGAPTVSIDALAAGLWPRFPGMPGPTGIRINPALVVPPAPATPLAPPTPVATNGR